MLRVLSVCLSVVLVGVFLIYYGHLDEPVELVSFPPSIFGLKLFWLYLQQQFVLNVLAS